MDNHIQEKKRASTATHRKNRQEILQKDGKIPVDIEVCRNCQEHQWCTRHDEQKYSRIYEQVSSAIYEQNTDVIVVKNSLVDTPLLGAFEVTCMGCLLFSKNKSGSFPCPLTVASIVKDYLQDKKDGKPTIKYDFNQQSQVSQKINAEQREKSPMNNRSPNNRMKSPNATSSGFKKSSSKERSNLSLTSNKNRKFVISSSFAQGKRGSSPITNKTNQASSKISDQTPVQAVLYQPSSSNDQEKEKVTHDGNEDLNQNYQNDHDENKVESPHQTEQDDQKNQESLQVNEDHLKEENIEVTNQREE